MNYDKIIESGTYQLHISISKNIKLTIGKLGEFNFLKGNYIYTGSAMKNFQQRVARHLRKEKKLKWHIDYLLDNKYAKIKKVIVYPSNIKNECEINISAISSQNTEIPVPKFGSSDCRICPSHLIKIID